MSGQQPRFTFVSAVYNVGRYLPDFIASLEAQTHGLDDVEIVMVDDGSTDDSAQVLTDWAARRPDTVRVIRQANAGQGAARNAGILAARGEWISFPDPDDALSPDYLGRRSGLPRHPPRRRPGCLPPADVGRADRGHEGRPPAAVDVPWEPVRRPHDQPRAVPWPLSDELLPTRSGARARAHLRPPDPPELRGRPLQLRLPAQFPPPAGRLPRLSQVPLPTAG